MNRFSRLFDALWYSDTIAMKSLRRRRSQKGQIVVEYTLLLAIGVAIAMLITTRVVSRSEDNPGFLIAKWHQIIVAIGNDLID